MCGIAGILNLDGKPVDGDPVELMLLAIRHRGPDGDGRFEDGPVVLGHQRLAILDLTEHGHQPMTDDRYALVYNGEVYNHRELRAELEALGQVFYSRSDSEVVLRAFAEWGPDCVSRFNGMFAFAVWDTKRRELFLARDRYGTKPLYYAVVGDRFVFASEVKALRASGILPSGVDEEALLEYLTFQNTFGPQTLFAGVKLLQAGHTLTVRQWEQTPKLEQYWDFDFMADPSLTDEREAAEEVRRLLTQAVSRQMVADVDVGAFLSGGIDSSAIVTLAARQVPRLRTFTCGFDLSSASGIELAQDERAASELVSFEAGTEHYEVVLKAGDLERAMAELAAAIEEPRVGQSYPNYYVAGLASKFNKVVLSGVGGDELFGGYPWRYEDSAKFWCDRLTSAEESARLFRPLWRSANVSQVDLPAADGDVVDRALYFEAKTFLHGLLVVEDKLAMAHGLEVRFPFLDDDLVDFAMRIPSHMKVVRGVGKRVLREAVRPLLPPTIADSPKRGFSAPDGSWFRGQSLAFVFRELLGAESRIRAYVDTAVLKELLEEHVAGKVNRRLLIWSLLSVEYFLRAYA